MIEFSTRFFFSRVNALIVAFLSFSFLSIHFGNNAAGSRENPGAERSPSEFDTIATNLNDYLWPTDASRKVTSSFAEYRSTHFHGGIDISTNGQKGQNVFASRNGYVYRIVISPFGYGKMLYLRHPDGYFTTYAHLMTFNDAINRVARDEQYRRGTYAIDMTIDPQRLPVKKGEIIAYSGNTGYGPPHLHFEIRDEHLNPLNPLLCGSFRVEDSRPPRIKRLMIAPLTPASTVENGTQPRYFSRFPQRKHGSFVPQTIRVHGQIGFAIEAFDNVNGTRSKSGIHRVEFYLDDSLAFTIELDRVPVMDTKQIDLHYDFPSALSGKGKFQKLYLETGNILPFYGHRPEGAGIVNTEKIPEGEHNYRIACQDAGENTTVLTGKLLVNHKPEIQVSQVDEDKISISGRDVGTVSTFTVLGKKLSGSTWSQHTLSRSRIQVGKNGVALPINTGAYDVLKIVGETSTGAQSDPLFYFKKKPGGSNEKIFVAVESFSNYMKVTLTSTGVFTAPPKVTVKEASAEQPVLLRAVAIDKYVGAFTPSDIITDSRMIEAVGEVNGVIATAQKSFEVFPVSSHRSGSIALPGTGILVSFDSGAVFQPLFLRFSQETSRGTSIFEFEPTDVLLNKGIKFSIPVPSDAEKRHLGLYFRPAGNWILQSAHVDQGLQSISTTLTRILGDLAVLRDDEPPTIGRLRVQPHNGKLFVSFRYYDNLSGVDTDEIKLYIDDKPAIPEIEGEHRRAWYQSDERLERGKHSLKVVLKDKMKNEFEVSRNFSIK